MGPKPPDWRYLESLSPESLEEEEMDKVNVILIYACGIVIL